MSDFPNGKRAVVFVGDHPHSYDGIVKIYADSITGNWVVDTNMPAEAILNLLEETSEHFQEYAVQQEAAEEEGLLIMPQVPGMN